ncbi:hypothetical protein C8Q72DRAFT_425068 [Fomitopsis betulina]|nr:hypothetical protein C8Q72DRAFT_425068 [Fomitopsis betulina]
MLYAWSVWIVSQRARQKPSIWRSPKPNSSRCEYTVLILGAMKKTTTDIPVTHIDPPPPSYYIAREKSHPMHRHVRKPKMVKRQFSQTCHAYPLMQSWLILIFGACGGVAVWVRWLPKGNWSIHAQIDLETKVCLSQLRGTIEKADYTIKDKSL